MRIVTCNHCYHEFEVDGDIMLGEIVECDDCLGELEVIEIRDEFVDTQKTEEVAEDFGE